VRLLKKLSVQGRMRKAFCRSTMDLLTAVAEEKGPK